MRARLFAWLRIEQDGASLSPTSTQKTRQRGEGEGIVAKKMNGRFQAEWMNGSMVSDAPKLAWVSILA